MPITRFFPIPVVQATGLPTGKQLTDYRRPATYSLASFHQTVFPNRLPRQLAPTTPPRPTIRDEYRRPQLRTQGWEYRSHALRNQAPAPFFGSVLAAPVARLAAQQPLHQRNTLLLTTRPLVNAPLAQPVRRWAPQPDHLRNGLLLDVPKIASETARPVTQARAVQPEQQRNSLLLDAPTPLVGRGSTEQPALRIGLRQHEQIRRGPVLDIEPRSIVASMLDVPVLAKSRFVAVISQPLGRLVDTCFVPEPPWNPVVDPTTPWVGVDPGATVWSPVSDPSTSWSPVDPGSTAWSPVADPATVWTRTKC